MRMTKHTQSRLPFELQAVLFDLDGTLIASEIDFAAMKRGVLEIAARHGVSDATLVALDILGVIKESAGRLDAARAEALKAEAEAFLTEIEVRACLEAKPFPGACELLQKLAAEGIPVGIVTRNCRASADAVLSQFHLPHDLLLTRNDVANTKPHPEHLLVALRFLEAEPSHALMVGDHRMDIEGGKRAGVFTVGILAPDRPADFFDELKPDLVVRSLQEVMEWIFPSP